MEKPADQPAASTGHEWDGIVELDNPLPRWWLWVFYASIVFCVGYWILMPSWPGLNGFTPGALKNSTRAEVDRQLTDLERRRGAQLVQLRTASLEQIEADPRLLAYAQMVGQSVFGDNCATCHGIGGTGGKGYANLRDDVWLWGGRPADIQHTITVGVRSGVEGARTSKMPAFYRDQILAEGQIADLTEYVVSVSGRPAQAAAVARAAPLYAQHCVSCHGPAGHGDQSKGAPDLTDREWLYGSTRTAISGQIHNGRGGVMPAWGKRFSPEVIKALTVYVHSNAVGQ